MKMICPRCQTGLARRWAGKALYQLCVNCKGIAITKYALGGMADPSMLHDLWAQSVGESKPSEAKCPSCFKGMIYAYFSDGRTPVELDACPRCQILWFDRGEYEGMALNERPPSRDYMQIPAAEVLADGGIPVSNPELPDTGYGGGTVVLALLGLPVEEDVGPLARYPAVTRTLTAMVIVASVWGFAHPEAMVHRFAFRAVANPLVFLFTSFSSFFFHGGLWHLLGNMYFFWVFGDDVENELGHERYLALLALATVAGNVFYCLTPDSSTVPAIGASGGIAGLIAYYMIRFPYRRFRMMFFFMVFALRAWIAGGLYFLLEIVGAVSQLSGSGTVSHLSHLGGAVVGAASALAIHAWANAAASKSR